MFVDEKAHGEAQPVKVGTLRLSQYMRIGAQLRPQTRGKFFSKGGSCAWGAAYEGKAGEPLPRFVDHGVVMNTIFPEYRDQGLRFGVVARNDRGDTRESIADWLEAKGY